MSPARPDILFIMTDQKRFDDDRGALGNSHIYTPKASTVWREGGLLFSNVIRNPVPQQCCRSLLHNPNRVRAANDAGFQQCEAESCRGAGVGDGGPLRALSGANDVAFGLPHLRNRKVSDGKFPVERGPRLCSLFWRSEETYNSLSRQGDDYALWLAREHPEFDFLEQPIGERSEMYYIPQRSPLPAELGAEWWAADRAVERNCSHK